uniref:CCHC-type domain-containing protein n=1 Tax=Anolis carolinensis TaxID=28377 RepID=A0A803T1K6_ANOCA
MVGRSLPFLAFLMFMFPTVKVSGDNTESLVCSFRSGCGELTLSQEYGHHPAVAVRCNMQVEDEELLGAGGGRSERATPEPDAEFHQLAALASSTAYAQPNGVTQRRGVVRGDSTGGEEGSPSPGPQRMVFLEERMSAMETTLAVMSRAMERLAFLAEPERGRELRAGSMWDVSVGSSQGFADLPAPKGREMRKEPGARPKTQTSLTRVEESDDEGEKPPRIPATLPAETLVPLANAGRGTGPREAAAGPTGQQGGLRRAENWGLPPQGPLLRREELRIEFGGESSELDFFLTTVRGYMEDNAHTFRTESSRIRAIGAVLKRGAASWYVQLHARRDPCLGSLRRFMGALETRFRDPLEQIRAREKLKTVSQGQRSVSEYAEEFQCLAEKVPEWSAVTKIELFKEGLRREILSWAVHHDEPDTLRGWIQLAGRVETSLAQARRHRGGLQQRPQMKEGSRKEGSTPAGRRSEPTGNVSASRSGCFVCGRLGHRAAECWQRKGEGGGQPKPRAVAGKRAEEEPPMRHHSGGLVSQDKAMIVVPIQLENGSKQATCKAFVDCGCSRNIISPELAEGLGCERTNLESPIAFSQLDGSTASGSLAKYSAEDVKCKIGSWEGKVSFVISQIASYNVILGMPWLGQANPQINWEDKSMIFRMNLEEGSQEVEREPGKRGEEDSIRIAELADKLPPEYRDFVDVFDEKEADNFPPKRRVEVKIELVPGAERNLSSAFHPATNGGVERTQQTLCQFLRMYTNYRQDDWADLLPFAEMAFNGAVHSATGRAPFEIVYGQEVAPFPRLPEWKEGEGQTDKEWPAKIKQGWQTVVEALRETQKKYKLFADRRRREGDKLGEGDLVWLSTKNLKLGFPSKKLAPRYIGPFRVAKRINEVTYELRLPKDLGKVHPVFHCSLLKKYKGTLDSGEQ